MSSPASSPVIHPRLAARRSRPTGTWWSKAMLRAVEEAAFGEGDLKAGRALARGGHVGRISIATGQAVASVEGRDDIHTVTVTLPVLDEVDAETFVEVVALESGRVAALVAGQLPHPFVEAVEEAGVELLPYGGEIGSECSCDAWLDPCPHALAVLTQVAWLVEADPFVLTHLRGLSRDDVLARVHALSGRMRAPDLEAVDPDLLVAEAAVWRARAWLADYDE